MSMHTFEMHAFSSNQEITTVSIKNIKNLNLQSHLLVFSFQSQLLTLQLIPFAPFLCVLSLQSFNLQTIKGINVL